MAIATRSQDGRASSRYSDGELYGLVRRVAVWANRRRPTKITQAEFDRGRAGAGLADLPSARAICMRLGSDSESMPWAEVLEIACTEQARPEIGHGHRRGGGEAPHLDERHLYFALNRVAQHLGVRSLTPGDYERGRGELIERESRRRTGRHSHQPNLLEELLPNAAQIERIIGGPEGDAKDAAPASAAANSSGSGSKGRGSGGHGSSGGDSDGVSGGDSDGVSGGDSASSRDDVNLSGSSSGGRDGSGGSGNRTSGSDDDSVSDSGGGAGSVNGAKGDLASGSDEQIAAGLVWGGRGVATGGADWDRALSAAGLGPRVILEGERHLASRAIRGLPMVEAIHHFVEANDRWPSRPALTRFAELADIGVETHDKNKPWSAYIAAARAFRAEQGLASPARMPGEVRAGLSSIRIPANRIPGAPRRRKVGAGQNTREELLDALERFDRELPAGASRTRAAYARFAKENGLPSPTTLDRRGDGFTAMLAEVRARRAQAASGTVDPGPF